MEIQWKENFPRIADRLLRLLIGLHMQFAGLNFKFLNMIQIANLNNF